MSNGGLRGDTVLYSYNVTVKRNIYLRQLRKRLKASPTGDDHFLIQEDRTNYVNNEVRRIKRLKKRLPCASIRQ